MHPADARGQVRCARAAPMRSHLDMAFRRGEVCVTHEAYSAADTLQPVFGCRGDVRKQQPAHLYTCVPRVSCRDDVCKMFVRARCRSRRRCGTPKKETPSPHSFASATITRGPPSPSLLDRLNVQSAHSHVARPATSS